MRIRPKYITTLLVAGAAAATIAAAPTAVAAPASALPALPAGITTAPMDDHGGDHGGWGGGDHGGWGGGDHRGWGDGDRGGWQWWLPHWGGWGDDQQ